MIIFDKLWITAQNQGITKYALHHKYGISKSQLYRLAHNETVNTCTLDRLCNILHCSLSEIIDQIPDDNVF